MVSVEHDSSESLSLDWLDVCFWCDDGAYSDTSLLSEAVLCRECMWSWCGGGDACLWMSPVFGLCVTDACSPSSLIGGLTKTGLSEDVCRG